ncbi:interleukin-20 receptor subunit alpha isoform X2 [Periophthalmus magnuspinnatus]|uniref:interleukin-20 receptor subunit alpha isoform X2 n=1 Tax=Periophthalmus magnuspinnatus TaxID=409849 RepID=UPI002436622B|nr:interleukin-20 receptor subunit alpha isoform X2 [Periophthalmus magnuspinnatus]
MWASLFLMLVFCTALSSTPNPTNVTFASENFRNILKWSPGYGTPADTKYSVRYAIYGDSLEKRVHWRTALHCTEISRTWCDLSVETSDLEHGYFAKVRAVSQKRHSKWVETPNRFDPKIETEFGPPHVSLEVDDKYVIISMEGPMRYLPHNHTSQVSMATLYPHMTYNLSIHNTHTGVIRHFTLSSKQFKYRIVDQGIEYCFSAKTKIEDRHMPSKHHSSACHCIATPKVPLIDRLEKIIICTTVSVVLLCLLAVGGYVLHKYLSGTDQRSPYILNPTFYPPPLPIPSENFNIIVIPVNTFASSGGTYASQNSFLQTSPSSVHLPLLSKPVENHHGLSLQKNSETGTLQLQFSQNESSDVIEGGSVISSTGYAAQSLRPEQPTNQLDDLPDDYGVLGLSRAEDTEEVGSEEQEDGFLHLDWSPKSRTLIIPGLDLGLGQRDRGGPPNLETVFVRQPSEDEALLGAERIGSGQRETGDFLAKWNLIVSDD